MAAFNKFESFVDYLVEGVNLASDALTIALSNAANPPSASLDAVLTDITTVATTNIVDKTLNVTAHTQVAGVYKLICDDQVLLSSGGPTGPFRYVILYDDTVSDCLIGWWDYASEITLADGEQLTLDFSAANGVLQIT